MIYRDLAERFVDVREELLCVKPKIVEYQSAPQETLEDAATKLKGVMFGIESLVLNAKSNISYVNGKLNRDEAAAIYLYTTRNKIDSQSIATKLNKALRHGSLDFQAPWRSYLKLFTDGLSKLEPLKTIIWRCCKEDLRSKYQVNCTYVWYGFSSCTKTKSIIEDYFDRNSLYTVFKIQCINGKSIQNYSSNQVDDEVLLMPFTSFKVLQNKEINKGIYLIHLEELYTGHSDISKDSNHSSIHKTIPMFHESSKTEISSDVTKLSKKETPMPTARSICQLQTDKTWLNCQYHTNNKTSIMTPKDLESMLKDPPIVLDSKILNVVKGSMLGMALGDALGAHVEFRPYDYLQENPVEELEGGGTWGLQKGQFTDDTSMALCLACSLVCRRDFIPYDQLVRYKWWYKHGYMSSTGNCFDIGAATSQSIKEFEDRQRKFSLTHNISLDVLDFLADEKMLNDFDICCSEQTASGNGALMRLAPVPLFFYRDPKIAVKYSGISASTTHGDKKARDACRYYGALIVAALNGEHKDDLLDEKFYEKHKSWFSGESLADEILNVAKGSFKKSGGYKDGIRGKGYVVFSLEAALWAFWSDNSSFETGVLKAINLGDDTDTTAAIYGQLAGAYYGYDNLPLKWTKEIYAGDFIECLSKWIVYEGNMWKPKVPSIHTPQSTTSHDSPVSTTRLKYPTGAHHNLNSHNTSEKYIERRSDASSLTNRRSATPHNIDRRQVVQSDANTMSSYNDISRSRTRSASNSTKRRSKTYDESGTLPYTSHYRYQNTSTSHNNSRTSFKPLSVYGPVSGTELRDRETFDSSKPERIKSTERRVTSTYVDGADQKRYDYHGYRGDSGLDFGKISPTFKEKRTRESYGNNQLQSSGVPTFTIDCHRVRKHGANHGTCSINRPKTAHESRVNCYAHGRSYDPQFVSTYNTYHNNHSSISNTAYGTTYNKYSTLPVKPSLTGPHSTPHYPYIYYSSGTDV